MKLLVLFIMLSVANTVLQTAEKLIVVKCGKNIAACFSALCFGFYTVVIVYTMCELPLWAKAGITAICQFCGVFAVKSIEQSIRKDRLWKIEVTIEGRWIEPVSEYLAQNNIEYSIINLAGGNAIFNIYCNTQAESLKCKQMIETYNGKYFASECKNL